MRQSPFQGVFFHILVDVCSCGWDCYCDVLLTLYCDPDVLEIGALPPGISRQDLGGGGELVRLGSRPHIVNATLEVLCQPTESNYLWTYCVWLLVLPSWITISSSVSSLNLRFRRGRSIDPVSGIRLGGHVD